MTALESLSLQLLLGVVVALLFIFAGPLDWVLRNIVFPLIGGMGGSTG